MVAVGTSTKVQYLPIDSIRQDGGTQSRVGISWDVVDEYAEEIKQGAKFPPVTVFYDGQAYWLADGFHRVLAHQKAELKEIAVDLQQGTRRDAVLCSVQANGKHGLRRTNADKLIALQALLRDEEWSLWSDNKIAQICGVTQPYVSKHRELLYSSSNDYKTERIVQRNGKTYTMDTAKIGKSNRLSSATSHHYCNDDTPSKDITSTTVEEQSEEVEHTDKEQDHLELSEGVEDISKDITSSTTIEEQSEDVEHIDKEQDQLELSEDAEDVSKDIVSEAISPSGEEELPLEVGKPSYSPSSVELEQFARCDRTDASSMIEITAMLTRAEFPSSLQITNLLNTFEQNLGAETFGKLVVEAVPLSNLANLCNRCLAVLNLNG